MAENTASLDRIAESLARPVTVEDVLAAYKIMCFRGYNPEHVKRVMDATGRFGFNSHQVFLNLLELEEFSEALGIDLVKLYAPPVPMRMDFGAVVFGHVWDHFVSDFIRRNGYWEPEVQATIRHLVRPDDVVIDVGANIGSHAALMALLVGPGGMVHAFEPVSYNLAALRRMIPANGFTNIILHPVAVSSAEGLVQLNVHASNSGGNSVSANPGQDANDVEYVRAVRLDDHLLPKLDRADFIKIDVEGHEHHVLAGAAALIERFRPTVLMEMAPANLRQRGADPVKLLDDLIGVGLRVSVVGNSRTFGTGAEVVDYIETHAPFMDIVAERPS